MSERVSDEIIAERCQAAEESIQRGLPANFLSQNYAVYLDLRDARKELAEKEAEVERLKKLLYQHHHHHLDTGPIGLPDGSGGWIEIDNADAYSESTMCDQTVAALDGVPIEHVVEPRGAVKADWWAFGVKQRRLRKAAEAKLALYAKVVEAWPTARAIIHASYHLLDDSEERVVAKEIVVLPENCDALKRALLATGEYNTHHWLEKIDALAALPQEGVMDNNDTTTTPPKSLSASVDVVRLRADLAEAVKGGEYLANLVEKLAFEMPAPNVYTPRFVQLAVSYRAFLAKQKDNANG